MKRLIIATGILLVALGAYIVSTDPKVHTQGTVSLGPIHSTIQEQHTVPALFGWVAIVGGVLVGIVGIRRKR